MQDNTQDNMQTIIYLNDRNIGVAPINVNVVEDIAENELFGVVVNKKSFSIIRPKSCFLDEGSIKLIKQSALEIVEDMFDYNFPLVFKKLSDNFAQEILSKEVFGFIDENKSNDEITTFQKEVEKYRSNNVVINCSIFGFNDNKNAFFTVNDTFKYAYGIYTLPKKDEIVTMFKKLKEIGKIVFEQGLQDVIDSSHGVANAENLIYDFENKINDKHV